MLCVSPQLLNCSVFLVLNTFCPSKQVEVTRFARNRSPSPHPSGVLVVACRCCLAQLMGRWSSWTAMAGCWPTSSCTSLMASSACPGTTLPSWWRTAVRATPTRTTTPLPKVAGRRREGWGVPYGQHADFLGRAPETPRQGGGTSGAWLGCLPSAFPFLRITAQADEAPLA